MIKLKVLPTFPSSIAASGLITLTKTNGIYTIGFDVSQVNDTTIIDPIYTRYLSYNRLTGEFALLSVAQALALGTTPLNVNAATYAVQNSDVFLRLQQACVCNLPPSAAREGLELYAKNVGTAANSSLVPSGTEDIDGYTAGAGGYPLPMNYQVVRIKPRLGGWDVMHSG